MDHGPTHDMLITMAIAFSGGALLFTLARRMGISAILLLLAAAFGLGPESLGWLKPASLGDGLRVIVSLAIGLILFEGGLTLDPKGYKEASAVIRKMLSLGVLATWFLVALAVKALYPEFGIASCLAFGSLVIVTGPTVIAPLLRRIRLQPKLHNILHWEGVLIDPIGVFIALMCYEFLIGARADMAVFTLLVRFVGGIGVGAVGGLALAFVLKRRLVPPDMVNTFSFGFAILVFGVADALASEAGLLSVTVAGFIVGLSRPPDLGGIRHFKAEMTDILIGMLFLILASRLRVEDFVSFGWRGALLVGIVIFVVRPLAMGLVTRGTDLTWRERVFLGWVAPRGIVAASLASAVALSLHQREAVAEARFAESFVYSVILSTVLLQELTAGLLARILKLQRPRAQGWMIVGAHPFARRFARFLVDCGTAQVVLVDTNPLLVADARREGLDARAFDARDPRVLEDQPDLNGVGSMLALTDNENLNLLVCQRWSRHLGHDRTHSWTSHAAASQLGESPVTAVWTDLPKPSVIAEELQRREAFAQIAEAPLPPENADGAILLACVEDKRVRLLSSADAGELPAKGHFLYLRREADYLAVALRPHLVVRTNVADQREFFTQLVGLAVRTSPNLDVPATVDALMERERTAPTSLGHGIAIPHITTPLVDSRVCAMAQTPNGAPFESPDGKPVHLVFLILSPADDPEGHLATLAEIARLVSDPVMRGKLTEETDPDRILDLVQEHGVATRRS